MRTGRLESDTIHHMVRLLKRVWPHLVAIYVLFHVASVVVSSAPAPSGVMNRSLWKDPTVQDEIKAWSGQLSALGIAVQPEQLEEAAWRLGAGWMNVRNQAMRPFRTYQRYTATVQSWRMFVAPHRYPSRVHIDIREPGGDWKPVYVGGSGEHTWCRRQLNHVRMRKVFFAYSWNRFQRSYDQLSAWLAHRAAEDFPSAAEPRVRFYKYRTLAPDEVREHRMPAGRFVLSKVVNLERYR